MTCDNPKYHKFQPRPRYKTTTTIPSVDCETTVFLWFSCPRLRCSELFVAACCSTLTTDYMVLPLILLIPKCIQLLWVWEPSKMCLGRNILMALVHRLIQIMAGRINFEDSTPLVFRIFCSNVKSVLLYRSETRKDIKITASKLLTFINRCLQWIPNIHWLEVI
jgi:hypothetical protein